jgi:hypothetical protein
VRRTIPASAWQGGKATVTVNLSGEVTRVVIDPEQAFPDVDRENNTWRAGR